MLKDAVFQTAAAGLGTLGFALLFRVPRNKLLAATIGGILAWALYLGVRALGGGLFLANLAAAAAVSLCAELMARRIHAPVILFLAPGIIPLLPGGALYRTMLALIQGDPAVRTLGRETAIVCLGIAAGIVLVSAPVQHLVRAARQRKTEASER